MMKPREPEFQDHGLVVDHDMRCAVFVGESAVFNCNIGVFEPSWKAQADGWRLVRVKKKWQKKLLEMISNHED